MPVTEYSSDPDSFSNLSSVKHDGEILFPLTRYSNLTPFPIKAGNKL